MNPIQLSHGKHELNPIHNGLLGLVIENGFYATNRKHHREFKAFDRHNPENTEFDFMYFLGDSITKPEGLVGINIYTGIEHILNKSPVEFGNPHRKEFVQKVLGSYQDGQEMAEVFMDKFSRVENMDGLVFSMVKELPVPFVLIPGKFCTTPYHENVAINSGYKSVTIPFTKVKDVMPRLLHVWNNQQ